MFRSLVLIAAAVSVGYWIESTRRRVSGRRRGNEATALERWEGEGGSSQMIAAGHPDAQPPQ